MVSYYPKGMVADAKEPRRWAGNRLRNCRRGMTTREMTMRIGIVGLGRMGANIARRAMASGHSVVGYNLDPARSEELAREGMEPAATIDELAEALSAPRVAFVYVPHGAATVAVLAQLREAFGEGDIVVDGGNSRWSEAAEQAVEFARKGIRFLDVGTSGGYGGLITFNGQAAGADPERTESVELGTKWNIFDGKLLLAAALFETRKSDVMEGADYDSAGTFNTGKNRIRGVEVSATGNITEKLSAQVGYVTMDSEVLDSFSEANEGKTLSNFADNSGYALLRYQLTEQLAFGGAVKYESKRYAGQPDSAAAFNTATGAYSQPIPSYTVIDLFGEYEFTKQLNARLNLGNITDKEYYLAAYPSGSFLYYGDAFNARLTLNYEF